MPPELPTGVVTLLFTDIEGSTKLLAKLRTDYAAVLARHREVLRAACESHGGVVVDSQGDAMLIAFARPGDAVAAATEGQRALHDGPVNVRMGLHTGTPDMVDGAYVGLDVHRGARVGAAGHGGQVLLSATTQALTDEPVVDLGRHHLRGLEQPEHIFQLSIPGLPDRFPPLTTVEADRPELPRWSTSFVGRESELQRIETLLGDPEHRLISIVGPGGAGKSRLAAEAARRYWERHRRRTVFVPLVTVATEEQLVVALADALDLAIDLAHSAGRAPADQLVDFLRERSILLVADNCEQIPSAANVFSRVLTDAPDVQLLITSRSRLGLAAEWPVDVAGLSGPDRGDEATRLFVERARQHDPDLSIGDEDWAAVARICRLTENMPLAIELAAAWMGVLAPSELADELERDLDILATRSPDAPARHRSLRAAFGGSWRLLDEEQRRVLAGLSVFGAPFARDMAASVAGAGLTTLAELTARSLVRRAGQRYEMHELIHRYAAEQLEERGAVATMRETHARFFVEQVVSREARLRGPDSRAARYELRPSLPDIRAAAAWAVGHWPSDEVEPLLRGLAYMWAAQVDPAGPPVLRELWRVVEEERDRTLDEGAEVPMRSRLASHLAMSLASIDDNRKSDAIIDAHLEAVRASGDRWALAMLLLARGMNHDNRDENAAAIAPLEEADVLFAALGDELMRADTLTWLGWARLMLDDATGARVAFEEAKRLALSTGDPVTIAFTESKLGLLDDAEGRPADGLRRHLDAFASFEGAGNDGGVGFSLSRASLSSYVLGDHRGALDFATAAYEAFQGVGHSWGSSVAAERVGFAYLRLGRPAEARAWALRGLRLVADGEYARLGRLSAVSVIAAAYVSEGQAREWLPILRAVVADPDMPGVYAVQPRQELAIAEASVAAQELDGEVGREAPDLDVTIGRLMLLGGANAGAAL